MEITSAGVIIATLCLTLIAVLVLIFTAYIFWHRATQTTPPRRRKK